MMLLRILAVITTVLASFCHANERGVDLPLYYDVETGNVTIDFSDVKGGVLSSYSFGVGHHHPLGFVGPHTPFMNTVWTGWTSNSVGETNWSGIDPGVYSLGNILPIGLSREEFDSYFLPDVSKVDEYGLGGFVHEAVGTLGTGIANRFSPQYRPTPFPPLNDPDVGPPAVDWATEVLLTYNETSGELGLDATGETGGAFMSYFVRFRDPITDLSKHQPITSKDFLLSAPRELGEVSMTPITKGEYSIGTVLEPGLTADELSGLIRYASFMGEPQGGQKPLDIDLHGTPMMISVVPEPSTAMPIWIGSLVGFGWFRSRRFSRRFSRHPTSLAGFVGK